MAQRKLQTDVVKTIKRVTEGVEAFETLFTKMEASTNAVQKEKCETDLKTQIKKLQRLRDQIKTWIASSEIKDKEPLTETRKLIETQMERFKALEKEMKTKAFSKEGLIAATKLDPAEKAKLDANNWLSSMIDELSRQVEQSEAEIELLAASQGKKRGKGAGGERVGELERLNERRKWHVGRMELVQRMLDNGGIPLDKVLATKEDISYFVESNTEEDFEEDEGIYDDLDLQEDEDHFGLGEKDDILSSHDSQSLADEVSEPVRTPAKSRITVNTSNHDEESSNSSGALARKTSLDDASTSPSTKKTPVRKTTLESKPEVPKPPPVPSPNFAQQPMSSALKAGLPSNPTAAPAARPPAAAPLPAIRYAAAAAAAVAPPTPTFSAPSPAPLAPPQPQPSPATLAPAESLPPPIPSPSTEASYSFAAPSPPPSHLSTVSSPRSANAAPQQLTPSPAPSLAEQQKQQEATRGQQQNNAPPSLNNYADQSPIPSHTNGAPSPQPPSQQQAPQQPPYNPSSANISPLPTHTSHPSEVSPSPQAQQPGSGAPLQSIGHGLQQQQQQQQQQQGPPGSRNEGQRLPNALADLVSSFENAKQRSASRTGNMDQMHSALDASFHALPHPTDAEKPRNYVPKNPIQNPPHYPQEPFAGFQDRELYPKMDLDTLFYIFYYHAGTYEQWLAARELKKQSWRFHKQYLTWFQRLSQPQAITDDYEQGMYIYFDWENSWCQRKKADFRFEYRYLSEDA